MPSRFAVFAGYNAGDLEEVRAMEVDEPCGWVEVDVRVDVRVEGKMWRDQAVRAKPRLRGTRAIERPISRGASPEAYAPQGADQGHEGSERLLCAHMLQLAVLANQANGKCMSDS
ncbi:hypothetical protein M427DRAFT_36305 [Gonapodya prolifera JEL478]|uniref:DOC domain-containing protein n=1 Tax=Gonapodya prolifera (strain JEL478) TaxID=1344416 RepID=A0A139A2U7_GONPJ|nr:hypothetical protein M427DRAFT_36305 [Gonapodya prolifera JEL478]|eukprot:KXS11116.1 hypothetical protein M427DRAFT_36305 [Gonapodya prolifera JEL478]